MKYILIAIVLISCQKSNQSLAKVRWEGTYYRDTVFATNAAYACPGDRSWPADTVLYYNHGLPPTDVTTWREIHVGMMQLVTVTPYNNLFIRVYIVYNKRTDL